MRPSQCYRFGWLWPSLSNLGVLYLLICSFLQNFRWIEMAPYFKILGSWRALLFHLNIFTFNIESESESHSVVSDSLWPHGLYSPWNSPGQNTRVSSLSFFQGIFPNLGLNRGLLQVDSLPVEPQLVSEVWTNSEILSVSYTGRAL